MWMCVGVFCLCFVSIHRLMCVCTIFPTVTCTQNKINRTHTHTHQRMIQQIKELKAIEWIHIGTIIVIAIIVISIIIFARNNVSYLTMVYIHIKSGFFVKCYTQCVLHTQKKLCTDFLIPIPIVKRVENEREREIITLLMRNTLPHVIYSIKLSICIWQHSRMHPFFPSLSLSHCLFFFLKKNLMQLVFLTRSRQNFIDSKSVWSSTATMVAVTVSLHH